MRGPCPDSNCTFNMTRVCVRGLPSEECPNRPLLEDSEDTVNEEKAEKPDQLGDSAASSDVSSIDPGGAVLQRPTELPTLPPSRTLGIAEANAIMEARPTCMIGIVGLPGAGKTACLVSAYLLLAKGECKGFSYADSETLRAFEEIARGSRTWVRGNPPEQITVHTTLSNDREAGFLHLRLKRESDCKIFDLLLPDLPGEWSKQLIDLNDSGRLEFLRSSSVIWFMVDGRQFANEGTVAYARYRASLLLERLSELLDVHRPRVLIVPTWHDAGEFPTAEAEALAATAARWGFETEMVPIASFSWNAEVAPGDGVARLVERSISPPTQAVPFWPETEADKNDRALAAFRGRQ
jgi:hypothetical protein